MNIIDIVIVSHLALSIASGAFYMSRWLTFLSYDIVNDSFLWELFSIARLSCTLHIGAYNHSLLIIWSESGTWHILWIPMRRKELR